jgi:6-pyruvoyltetrahydropterin/6-carboxytetrahydropterin synthase
MAKIRLTKEFRFETSHALWNYDGLCKNMHGHSYILFVTVIGEPISDKANPKYGMVMDFGELKKIVNNEIVNPLDHSVILNKRAPYAKLENLEQMFERIHIWEIQPTCENMVVDFAKRIKKQLPSNVKLFAVKLHETATSYAEWFAEDN